MSRFINTELKSDSDSEKVGGKFDNKLMTKFEKSGSDSVYSILLFFLLTLDKFY